MPVFRSESTLVFSLHTKGITTQGRATISVIFSIHYFKEILTILTIVSFSFPGKCLYLAGLVPEPMTADDDFKLVHFGIGFTNMVARATKGSADLTRKEIREGML